MKLFHVMRLAVSLLLMVIASWSPAATFTVNSSGDEDDGDLSDGICDTGNARDGYTGLITLRAAMENGRSSDTIVILSSLVVISPKTVLPALRASLSGAGYDTTVIDGSEIAGAVAGIRLEGSEAAGLSVSNLTVVSFGGIGIAVRGAPVSGGADDCTIQNCSIVGNGEGLRLEGVNNAIVRKCIISANTGNGITMLSEFAQDHTSGGHLNIGNRTGVGLN
ncbi:MAG: right-handed parallel beta-helix repeat-containing protein [bacterium]|nr:right-handed parallel beta-helix repeat-containing protein [bacterium]